MGFWNKLGKIGLTVAPYVAAPFTGGASLAFVPMANQAVGAWNAADARKAAERGIAPSNFDKYLGMAGNIAGMAGGAGAFGKGGSTFGAQSFGGTGEGLKGWQGALSKVGGATSGGYGRGQEGMRNNGGSIFGGMMGGGRGGEEPNLGNRVGLPPLVMNYGGGDEMGGFQRQMQRQLGDVMGRMGQSNPNLAESIGAGRMEAIRNQPFRRGYDVDTLIDIDRFGNPIIGTTRMPRISTGQYGRRGRY